MARVVIKGARSVLFQNFQNYSPLATLTANRSHSNPKQNSSRFKVQTQIRYSSTGLLRSPLGTSVDIPKQNLIEYVWSKAEPWMDKTVATCAASGRTYSFGMIRMMIERCAKALLSHCGMKPGEVIGLLLPNIPEFIVISHGALEAGLIVTFVNPLYTADELKRQYSSAGVKMIVCVPQLLDLALKVAPQLSNYKTTICIGGDDDPARNIHGMQSLLMAGHEAELPIVDPSQIAILPYSSGTTGLPKGVQLSHYNLVANLVQSDIEELAEDKTTEDSQKKILTVLPFFHIYGFNGIMNIALKEGYHTVTIPRFTPEDYIKALIEYKPDYLFVVPSLLLFLATHPDVKREHLTSVTSVMSGAALATEGVLQKFREKVGRDNINIRQGYGMTESAPVTICMPRNSPKSKVGTIGTLYPGTEAKIVSLLTGEVLGPHKSGELLVRGPQVMVGYLNNEKATAETIDKDGWLHTGDVAYYDEDTYFFIVDRSKDLIKVKGNQVSPTELENLILEVPGVVDTAVVGIPDTLAGELPRAFVVKKAEAKVTEDDILTYVNPKVTNYKKLAGGIRFIKAIPRNPSGKVLRNELKIAQ